MEAKFNLELLGRRVPSVYSIGVFMVVLTISSMLFLPNKILYVIPLVSGVGLLYLYHRFVRSRSRVYYSVVDLFVAASFVFGVGIMSIMYWITIVQSGGLSLLDWMPYFATSIVLTNGMWLVIGFLYARSVEIRRENESLARELEEQNRRVEMFAGALSHDLRNPLSIIQGYAELLDGDNGDEEEKIETIIDACDRANQIVDDSLSLARDDVDFEMVDVEVSDVAQEAWEMSEISGLELEIVSSETIVTDETYFKQMLENLYRNADEHARSAGVVSVGVEGGVIFVEDDGDNAPEWMLGEDISRFDDRFGLGFSIVAFLAQKQEWEISLWESESGGLRVEFDMTGN